MKKIFAKKLVSYFGILILGGFVFSIAYVVADGFGQHKHHSADIVDSSGGRSPDVGVVTCPSGFSRVGPAGGRNSYCISTDEETAAYSDTARNACIAKNTGSQGPAHMCSSEEWYIACYKIGNADVDIQPLNDTTDDYEWVADYTGSGEALRIGSSSCSTTSTATTGQAGNQLVYRCCFR